jgi:hypothetical protein
LFKPFERFAPQHLGKGQMSAVHLPNVALGLPQTLFFLMLEICLKPSLPAPTGRPSAQ